MTRKRKAAGMARTSGSRYTCPVCGDETDAVYGTTFPGGLSVQICELCFDLLQAVRGIVETLKGEGSLGEDVQNHSP